MLPLDEVRQFLPQAQARADPYVKEAFAVQVGDDSCVIGLYKTANGPWDCVITTSVGNVGVAGGYPTAREAFDAARNRLCEKAAKLAAAVELLEDLTDTTKAAETKE